MEMFSGFLDRAGYVAHGYCITWKPALLWTMVGSDATIAAAYFSIPLAIASFVRRRGDASLNWVAALFCAFIFACGLTHLMDIWTIWQPDYGPQAIAKLVTAAVSLVTAVVLWPLIPRALRIPSVGAMQRVIDDLQAEILRRHSAEDHLVEVERRLAATLGSFGAGYIAVDRAGRVMRMNAVAEEVTGWRETEAQGHSAWEVFDREGRPSAYLASNPVDIILQEGHTPDESHHVIAVSRAGRRTALEVKSELIRAADGSVRGMVWVFRDVTRLIEAESESNRLAAIVESSHDAIIGMTLEGRITSWNRGAQTIFGYAAEETVGRPVQMLIPPGRIVEELRILAELAGGRRVPAFDTVRQSKDGTLLEISLTISPIRDALGNIVGGAKIARNVSEQRRAERALQESEMKSLRLEVENRQIHEASRLKSQFLANMSHELRTPLNAIIGFAELLQSGAIPAESAKHAEFLGYIGTSGRHLLQLINDVLDLSKVEAGKLEFFPDEVNLPALITEVNDILRNTTQDKVIQVSVEVDPALPMLRLDPARLKQVLFNFLSNAIKFTADGGRVTVRARLEDAAHVRIEVEDTGIGIAAADLPRLFSEFQQLDAGLDKQHQGTGLGLALTRRLVEAQGGHVGVTSALGRGSVFFVVLNVVHGTDAGSAAERAAARDDDVVSGRGRLLVIDAGRTNQNRYLAELAGSGFAIDAATTGRQAVQFARQQHYDGITLNLELPDEPGLAVLESIRRGGASRWAPVVGVSMCSSSGDAAAFGIADVLGKPLISLEVVTAMAPYRQVPPHAATVLVVDDEPASRELMRATLQGIGIEAVCVSNGPEALDMVRRRRPDAIVLDLLMPDFDGFAVLDALRSAEFLPPIPVFIWTSMALSTTEYARLARSAQAIIGKGGGALSALLEELRRRYPQPGS